MLNNKVLNSIFTGGLFFLIIDQISKFIAKQFLVLGQNTIDIIPNVLSLHLVYNTGASWGLLAGKNQILLLITCVFLVWVIYDMFSTDRDISPLEAQGWAVLLGGCWGNFVDRIIQKSVTDFIDLLILPGNFPVFNFADIFIIVGVLLISISTIQQILQDS